MPAVQTVTPGQILGAYRLLEELGRGGMGQVFLAQHRALGKQVAIKVLRERFAADRASVQRFFREARTACSIEHPHIVEISDFVEDEGGRAFYVMEYLRGRTLEDRLEEGKLPLREALHIAVQIADAVAALHAAKIVHRDLKPANIFLVPPRSGTDGAPASAAPELVKLLDFGLAKLSDLDAALGRGPETNPDFLMGTPEYMAPEQISRPREVDLRADVYALGTLLYELLVGDRPLRAETAGELLVKLVTEPAPPLRQSLPDAPEELEALVTSCLAKDPEHRPATPALLEALRGLQREVEARSGEFSSVTLSSSGLAAVAEAQKPPPQDADALEELPVAPGRTTAEVPLPPSFGASSAEGSFQTASMAAVEEGASKPVVKRWLLPLLLVGIVFGGGFAALLYFPWGEAVTPRAGSGTAAPSIATVPSIATLAERWRAVDHRPREGRVWAAAERGLALAHLDALRTGSAARAEVHFHRGTTMEVAEESEVLIEMPRPLVEGGPAVVQVARLRRGVLRAKAIPGAPMQLIGRRGATTLVRALDDKPTRFRLLEHRDGRLEVAILAGRARVGRGEQAVDLGKAQLVEVRGKRLSKPRMLLPFPALKGPAVDAEVDAEALELRWLAVPGAKAYHLQIGRGASFATKVHDREVSTTVMPLRLPPGRYVWRVAAVDDAGHQSEYGFARRFSVRAAAQGISERSSPPKAAQRRYATALLSPPARLVLEIGAKAERLVARWRKKLDGRLVLATHRSLQRGVVSSQPISRASSGELTIRKPGRFFWGLCPKAGCSIRRPRISAARPLVVRRRPPPKVHAPAIDWPGKGATK